MRKKIDAGVRVRAGRLARKHQDRYRTVTAAVIAVAKQLDVSREPVRRWLAQDDVDTGGRPGVTSEDNAEIRRLRAENKKLQEKVDILRAATVFLTKELGPAQPMMIGFIDQMRAEGHAVESICAVLREQGYQIAARSYRAARAGTRGRSARAMSDALVEGLIRGVAYTVDLVTGLVKRTPEGLYGRRKMTAHLRPQGHQVSAGAVDRAMRDLGLQGVRRGRKVFTTVSDKTATRAPDLVERNFTAAEPKELLGHRLHVLPDLGRVRKSRSSSMCTPS